ncbi:hypothetical protein B0H13DRAFT_1484307, partial [Mycena leptocephala]
MLPFALKVVWFSLTILGSILSSLTIMALGSLIGCRWGPLVFSLGRNDIDLILCLGIIWRMDPYRMPPSFCLAQTILMSIGLYIVQGMCLAFTVAVSQHVLKPKQWGDISRSSLRWRPIYILPVVIFPLVLSALRIGLIIKYNAVQPFDAMHCDASEPLLVRLAGYVLPWIIWLIPSLYLSVTSTRRFVRTLRHLERSRRDE